MASDNTTVSRHTVYGGIGQQCHPGGKLRLESGNRHLRQLLLEGFHRIAIIPHGLHVARGIQQMSAGSYRPAYSRKEAATVNQPGLSRLKRPPAAAESRP